MTLLFNCQALSSWRKFGDPYRIRTDVNGVRGRCLNHLTNGPRRRRNSLHFVSAFGENSISAPSFSSLLGKRFAGLPRSFTGDGGNGWGCALHTLKTEQRNTCAFQAACMFFVGQALGLLVPVSFIRYRTSTSGLSTR